LGDDWGFYFVCLARIEQLMFYLIKVGKLRLSLRMVQIRHLIFFVYVMEEHVKKHKILKNLKKTKILP
jgi:hypothetical protein